MPTDNVADGDALIEKLKKLNIFTDDVYITGSLETDPELIRYRNLLWHKKAQAKFTENGRDSFVFQATHPRGFSLIVYPYCMVDKGESGWEFIVFLKGWEHEWDSWEEGDQKYHSKSYFGTMLVAIIIADEWKTDPDNPEFPVSE